MSINNIAQSHWNTNELPGIDCIVYGDDTVVLLNIHSTLDNSVKRFYAFPVADTTIESLIKYEDDIWAEIQAHPNAIHVGQNSIVCGEGAMGNEGFVAVLTHGKLEWALFSTKSNPFIRLIVDNNTIQAFSDFVAYNINLNKPYEIKIDIL